MRFVFFVFLLCFVMIQPRAEAIAHKVLKSQVKPYSVKYAQVRIRLYSTSGPVNIVGFGLRLGDRGVRPVSTLGMQNISIEKIGNSTKLWKMNYEVGGSLRSKKIKGRKVVIEGDMMRAGVKPLPRRIELFVGKRGRIDVIASMDLDAYLGGVLPSEMPASWPIESLKAQAIASRSYALAVMKRRKAKNYHLESTILDQVFKSHREKPLSKEYRNKVERAIGETKGQVLMSRNRPMKAFFHSHCGGHTEHPFLVWGGSGRLASVKDNYCIGSGGNSRSWSYEISLSELNYRLKSYFNLTSDEKIKSIKPMWVSNSGRVINLKAKFSKASKNITSQKFREIFGFSKIKSTLFKLSLKNNILHVQGRGNGHGVGMCQWGAKKMAQSGLSHIEILRHYYPQSNLSVGAKAL